MVGGVNRALHIRPHLWLLSHYACACFRAMNSLALRVCSKNTLNLKVQHAYFSRGVQKVKNRILMLAALTFFCASRPRWRCYFQFLQPL